MNYAKRVSTTSDAWIRRNSLHGMLKVLTIGSVEGIAVQVISVLQGVIQIWTIVKVKGIAIQIVSVSQGAI